MKGKGYTDNELLACVASHILENGKSVFVGTGLPIIATMLAQKTHAPDIMVIFEAGGIGPIIPALPISVGDSRTFYRATAASSMHDVMSLAQCGYIDYGFLGAAQIDRFGNINTTVIGDYAHPTVRLPGSGGANDVGAFSHRTIVIMRQDTRRFVEKVDFVTTPGYLDGPNGRTSAGLPERSGPYRVVTQLGLFDFNEETKSMRLIDVHPEITPEEVQANSSFEIEISPDLGITAPPTPEELEILHHDIDSQGIVLGR